jgi:hypothetical protein
MVVSTNLTRGYTQTKRKKAFAKHKPMEKRETGKIGDDSWLQLGNGVLYAMLDLDQLSMEGSHRKSSPNIGFWYNWAVCKKHMQTHIYP